MYTIFFEVAAAILVVQYTVLTCMLLSGKWFMSKEEIKYNFIPFYFLYDVIKNTFEILRNRQ
jgi:hypothetical protein